MTKQQLNIRISNLTRQQLDSLTAAWGMTESEVISTLIDRQTQKESEMKYNYNRQYDSMNFMQLAKEAGVTPQHVKSSLYVYINLDGKPDFMQKGDKSSYPEDEMRAIGYATSSGYTLEEISRYVAE